MCLRIFFFFLLISERVYKLIKPVSWHFLDKRSIEWNTFSLFPLNRKQEDRQLLLHFYATFSSDLLPTALYIDLLCDWVIGGVWEEVEVCVREKIVPSACFELSTLFSHTKERKTSGTSSRLNRTAVSFPLLFIFFKLSGKRFLIVWHSNYSFLSITSSCLLKTLSHWWACFSLFSRLTSQWLFTLFSHIISSSFPEHQRWDICKKSTFFSSFVSQYTSTLCLLLTTTWSELQSTSTTTFTRLLCKDQTTRPTKTRQRNPVLLKWDTDVVRAFSFHQQQQKHLNNKQPTEKQIQMNTCLVNLFKHQSWSQTLTFEWFFFSSTPFLIWSSNISFRNLIWPSPLPEFRQWCSYEDGFKVREDLFTHSPNPVQVFSDVHWSSSKTWDNSTLRDIREQ